RRPDALLVGEAAIGADAVLTEEESIVTEEEDDRVVELAAPLERFEEPAYTVVDGRHHARAQPNLLLRAGAQRVQYRPRLRRFPQLDRLRPRRLVLEELLGCLHVRLLRKHAAAIEVLVPVRGPIAFHLDRPVRRLLRVGMDGFVGEPQRPWLGVLA